MATHWWSVVMTLLIMNLRTHSMKTAHFPHTQSDLYKFKVWVWWVVQCEMTRRKTHRWTDSILFSEPKRNKQKSGVIVPPNNDNRTYLAKKQNTLLSTHAGCWPLYQIEDYPLHTREWHIKGGCSQWISWHYYTEHQSHLLDEYNKPIAQKKWSFHAACHWCWFSLRLQSPRFTSLAGNNFYKASRPIPSLLLSLQRLPRPQRLSCCKF